MSSPLFVSLEQRLSDLEKCFIVRRDDYGDYIADDHLKALAYRLLASAALENYVEARCVEIATTGCERLGKTQPTATGRALMLWHSTHDRWVSAGPFLIHENDPHLYSSRANKALEAYIKSVRRSHGVSGDDLRALVFPLGLRENQVPEVLTTSLDALAEKRNPASHTYVNRARSQTEPALEVATIEQILTPLRQLDDDLRTVSETFPVDHL
ncbi:hypothetical protein [Aeromicrobium sp. 9AM]|uniref:hypothetical protein n=1 Tax=Aeromicrobium sp. 9AM TaxID=2653126 RepID=UPI00135A262B|nr:hypothetical protein [Aeromicrobium sp. 9AM]